MNNPPTAENGVIALVDGEPVTELPQALYIPPDAMRVILTQFQGPLDLLLYLIRKHDLDILDIPMAMITRQYLDYIEMMQAMRLTLAGEYLLMAAMLCEIKARLLLPKPPVSLDDEAETDPRAELVKRLQAYEWIKQAADALDELPQLGQDRHAVQIAPPPNELPRPLPMISLAQLTDIYLAIQRRAAERRDHVVNAEPLSVREHMQWVLTQASPVEFQSIAAFLRHSEGRLGVVVTLIAVLELVRNAMLQITQPDLAGPLQIKAIDA